MNNLPRLVGSVVLAGFFADFAAACLPMKWGFIALLVVLVVDFRYTRRYRRKTNRNVLPFCRALRLFVNKAVDYMGFLVVVAVLSKLFEGAIDPRVTRWVGMGVLFAIEAMRLLHKWLQLYHPDIDFDLFATLGDKWAVFRHVKRKDNATDQADQNRADMRGGADAEGRNQA